MKNEIKTETKTAKILTNVATAFCKTTSTSACCYLLHQPKVPKAMKEFLKNK